MSSIVKEFENGLRSVYVPDSFKDISHIALTVGAGTSNEDLKLNGIAHFIEHTLFKGTQKRKARQILSRIDSVGGELNAFTTKEETCVYISIHNQYLERAFELLSDLFYNSTFPPEELIKEKEVIKDEIRTYLDTPSEQIYDDFEGLLFKDHPLGYSILGTEQSLNRIKRGDILKFFRQNYTTPNTVISGSTPSGEARFNQLVRLYFSEKRTFRKTSAELKHRFSAKAVIKNVNKPVNQGHTVLGGFAYGRNNPKRTALVLLNNLLGGPGMNSRLNLNIREKYGFTYQIESNYQAYKPVGIFSIYFSTDFNRMEKTEELIKKELKVLCTQKLSTTQLHSAKRQFIGQLTLWRENVLNTVLSAGKSLLSQNKVDSFEEVINRIEKLNANHLLEVANETFDPNRLSVLNYIRADV